MKLLNKLFLNERKNIDADYNLWESIHQWFSYRGQMAKPKDLRDNLKFDTAAKYSFWNPSVVHEIHTSVSFSYTLQFHFQGKPAPHLQKTGTRNLKRTRSRPETNPHQTCPPYCEGQGWHVLPAHSAVAAPIRKLQGGNLICWLHATLNSWI